MENNDEICENCRCWRFREIDHSNDLVYGNCHYEPIVISKESRNFCVKGFQWNESRRRTAENN